MTELVERVEVDASVEEVYGRLSRLESVCEFVRAAEDTRRVLLRESWWRLRGPAGRTVEYGPAHLKRCLAERDPEGPAEDRTEAPAVIIGAWNAAIPRADLILDRAVFECKSLSATKTLVVLIAQFDRSADERRLRHLDLDALVSDVLSVSQPAHRHWDTPADDTFAQQQAGQAEVSVEDRGWLDADLSRLGQYEPYEWAEGELEGFEPVTLVPGLGLVVTGEPPTDDETAPRADR